MRILFIEQGAFVEMNDKRKHYLLCIGTREEVEKADDKSLADILELALATAKYNSLTEGQVIH